MELNPPDPRIGQLLQGRYRILTRVAAGAMGVVYQGERVELGRQVAVKFLHPWIAAHQAFRSRFETEARAMSRLSHPGCVSVIDFGFEGSPYLVMDFVTGMTLRQMMDRGRLPPARAVAIVRQLLAGLSHAHTQGIVHRDLKPENLILGDTAGIEDHLRILDFGLAKLRDGPAMTAGLAVGTPSYMSPEQAGAPGEIDGRTDIYAVGVLMFEMLAGRKPFVSEKVAEILLMHRESPVPSLRELAPEAGISAELQAAVEKALAKLAEDRFQTAADFAAALERVPEASGARPGARGAAAAGTIAAAGAVAPPAAARPNPDATIADPMPSPGGGPPGWSAESPSPKPSQPPAAAGDAAPARKGDLQRWIAIGAGAALALALVAVGISRRPRTPAPAAVPATASSATATGTTAAAAPTEAPVAAAAPAPAAVAAPAAPAAAPAAPVAAAPGSGAHTPTGRARLGNAEQLIAGGEWEQAVVVLQKARKEDPDSAAVAYTLANVCLEHGRAAEGAQAARVAGQREARYRGDERLVKNLIRSLAADKTYDRSQEVLRGFGAPAVPLLRTAAAHDKNPEVRQRAGELLPSRGHSTISRSRSSSSSSSSSRTSSRTSSRGSSSGSSGSFFRR